MELEGLRVQPRYKRANIKPIIKNKKIQVEIISVSDDGEILQQSGSRLLSVA